ncbi:unnamed protein product [Boreogadus saida]
MKADMGQQNASRSHGDGHGCPSAATKMLSSSICLWLTSFHPWARPEASSRAKNNRTQNPASLRIQRAVPAPLFQVLLPKAGLQKKSPTQRWLG